jgi:hypothetical protein
LLTEWLWLAVKDTYNEIHNDSSLEVTMMRRALYRAVYPLLFLVSFVAGSVLGSGRASRADAGAPSLAYVSGSVLSVYYPDQKRVYVYSELGGNCVFAYTLSTPGGFVARENCK